MKVLAIAASLRNIRHGKGNKLLVEQLKKTKDQEQLFHLLNEQTSFAVDEYMAAGKAAGLPFDEIYQHIRRDAGQRGLSNSEASLAAALWGAIAEGADVEYLSLANHFPPNGKIYNEPTLRRKLLEAEGIIISTPVYFGDRSSLVQSLFDYISVDTELSENMVDKVYGGISVGAKRNGGQETTLIYQMLDMVNHKLLAVGNSSDTTSQYGGTTVGGDIGTVHGDKYGLDTCIGTGRRVAQVANLLSRGRATKSPDKLIIDLWVLQRDVDTKGLDYFRNWATEAEKRHGDVRIRLWDIASENVYRCIACDICPTEKGKKDEYRCIITKRDDFFVREHQELIVPDAVLLCAYSPEDRTKMVSKYQQFIERTRYLRRDDYIYSNILVAPFVISELNARQNLHLRMMTSMIRHHTVMFHPIIGMKRDNEVLNQESVVSLSDHFISCARQLRAGRMGVTGKPVIEYNPIGYKISAEKHARDKHKE